MLMSVGLRLGLELGEDLEEILRVQIWKHCLEKDKFKTRHLASAEGSVQWVQTDWSENTILKNDTGMIVNYNLYSLCFNGMCRCTYNL